MCTCNRLKPSLMPQCTDCESYKIDEWNTIVEHECLEVDMFNNQLVKKRVEIIRDNYQWMLMFEGIATKTKVCIFCQRVLKHQLGIVEEIDVKEYLSIIKESI